MAKLDVREGSFGQHAIYGSASDSGHGVVGEGLFGVYGNALGNDVNRQGVRGEVFNSGGYAGLFSGGSTWVAGTLIKNAGAFMIDHPLEPESKYLMHSFVEVNKMFYTSNKLCLRFSLPFARSVYTRNSRVSY